MRVFLLYGLFKITTVDSYLYITKNTDCEAVYLTVVKMSALNGPFSIATRPTVDNYL